MLVDAVANIPWNDTDENSQGNKREWTSFKKLIIYALSIGWNKNSLLTEKELTFWIAQLASFAMQKNDTYTP